MARSFTDFDDFKRQYVPVAKNSRLHAMLLFDSRPSQKVVQKFAEENFNWIDEIARATGIYFFVCIRKDGGEVVNPCLEIAGLFGIRADDLPGILLFKGFPRRNIPKNLSFSRDYRIFGRYPVLKTGCYIPLKAKLFEEDSNHVEEAFTSLATIIKEALSASSTTEELTDQLRQGIMANRRRQRFQLLAKYCIKGLKPLEELPKELPKLVWNAFVHAGFLHL
jgi:hypothetical protein